MEVKSNFTSVFMFCISMCTTAVNTIESTPTPLSSSIRVNLENGLESPEQVRFIIGTTLNLKCVSDDIAASITWSKKDEKAFQVTGGSLRFDSVERDDAGVYICEVASRNNTYTKGIDVDILYPPQIPTIEGPSIVVLKETFTLTCTADSNPRPTYWWTFDTSNDATKQRRGQEFESMVYQSAFDTAVYCWVEVTMIPTVREPVTSKAYQVKRLLIHEPAYIWNFQPHILNVKYGDNVNIPCQTGGRPTPNVFYTKHGNTSFAQSGASLIAYNVQKEFDGLYSCHAENTMTPSGQPKRHTSHELLVRVVVEDPNIPENCKDACPGGTIPTVTCPTSKATSMSTSSRSENETPTSDGSSCNDRSCGSALIVALVLGWVVAVLVFTAELVFVIRKRGKGNKRVARAKDNVIDSVGTNHVELQGGSQSNNPARTQQILQSNEDGYASLYCELQDSTGQGFATSQKSGENYYDSVDEQTHVQHETKAEDNQRKEQNKDLTHLKREAEADAEHNQTKDQTNGYTQLEGESKTEDYQRKGLHKEQTNVKHEDEAEIGDNQGKKQINEQTHVKREAMTEDNRTKKQYNENTHVKREATTENKSRKAQNDYI